MQRDRSRGRPIIDLQFGENAFGMFADGARGRAENDADIAMKRKENSKAAIISRASLPLLLIVAVAVLLGASIYALHRRQLQELSALRNQIDALTKTHGETRKDLAEVRRLVERQPVVSPVQRDIALNVADAPQKGNPNAPVTLVEFTDYECGFCGRHVRETFPQLERDYIATGKLKYVFRNFPLESIHKNAFSAHRAAVCAGEQGKFWEMHDRLFSNQAALAPANLTAHAEAVGLDLARFQSCFNGNDDAGKVRRDIAEGQRAGVTSTPTFFLASTIPNTPTLKVSRTIRGAKPYAEFQQAIDALLTSQPRQAGP